MFLKVAGKRREAWLLVSHNRKLRHAPRLEQAFEVLQLLCLTHEFKVSGWAVGGKMREQILDDRCMD